MGGRKAPAPSLTWKATRKAVKIMAKANTRTALRAILTRHEHVKHSVLPTTDAPLTALVERAALTLGDDMGDMRDLFTSALLKRETDGPDLRDAFDRLAMVHPRVAVEIIRAGSLGGAIHWGRAVRSVSVYMTTGTAMAPALGC